MPARLSWPAAGPRKLRAAMLRWQRIERLANDLHAALVEEWQQGRLRYVAIVDDVFKKYLLRLSGPPQRNAPPATARPQRQARSRSRLALPVVARHLDQSIARRAKSIDQCHRRPCVRFVRAAMALVLPPDQVPRVPAVRRIVRKLGRGQPLGQFRYDPVVGAQRPWRRSGSIKPQKFILIDPDLCGAFAGRGIVHHHWSPMMTRPPDPAVEAAATGRFMGKKKTDARRKRIDPTASKSNDRRRAVPRSSEPSRSSNSAPRMAASLKHSSTSS